MLRTVRTAMMLSQFNHEDTTVAKLKRFEAFLIQPDGTTTIVVPDGPQGKFRMGHLQRLIAGPDESTGYVEFMYPPKVKGQETLIYIVNEDGRMKGLTINPVGSKAMDIEVRGPVLLVPARLID